MRKLTIYKRLFYQADCYTRGTKQQNSGVQVHSTGANNPYLHRYVGPDDGRIGPNKYNNTHNRPGLTVCASAYIGKMADGTVAVYQALPWDNRCWLSGSSTKGNANKLGYAGFEVCEDGLTDAAYFQTAVMGAAVDLTAYLCNLFGVGVEKVRDHSELHSMGVASNHGDITSWLKKFGFTMNDFRDRVNAAIQEGVEVTYIDCDAPEPPVEPLYYAEVTSTGSYLNLRRSKSKSSDSLKKLYKGTIVEVLNDEDSVWWMVRSEDVTGYAMHVGDKGETWLTPVNAPEEPEDDQAPALTFTVTINGLDWATAAYLVETYPGATAVETNG